MPLLLQIVLYTLLSGVLSLIGGVILLGRAGMVKKFSHWFVSFAAGALLSLAFLDLLPEALDVYKGSDVQGLLLWVLVGIVIFFLFERVVWHVHGHYSEDPDKHAHPAPIMLMVGDAAHNFLDGVAIATTFIANPALGALTAVGVALHELPQEIGDFSVLLHHGWTKSRTLWMNLLISLVSIAGAILAYFFRNSIETFLPQLLAITAGSFIYISASDLIPELTQGSNNRSKLPVSILLIAGILAVYGLGRIFE
jgi:zinc and cadmium transporter